MSRGRPYGTSSSRLDFGNIIGDPFALSTISIAIVSITVSCVLFVFCLLVLRTMIAGPESTIRRKGRNGEKCLSVANFLLDRMASGICIPSDC